MLRRLSEYELFYLYRGLQSKHVGFYLQLTFKTSLTKPNITWALQKTLETFPLLACNVVDDDGYRFLGLSLTFDDVVEYKDDGVGEDGVVLEQFMKWTRGQTWRLLSCDPLFRIVVLGTNTMAVLFEHTVADGMAGRYFVETFAQHLATAGTPLSDVIFDPKNPNNKPIPPPIDQFMPWPNPGDKITIDRLCPDDAPKWEGRFPAVRPNTMAFKHIHFSVDEVNRILATLRRHGVSLTVYVFAIITQLIKQLSGDNVYQSHCAAMSVRHFIPEEYHNPNIVSVVSSLGIHQWWKPEPFSWKRLQEAHKTIRQDAAEVNLLQLLQGYVDFSDNPTLPWGEFFDARLGLPSSDTSKVSNLGAVKSEELVDLVFWQDLMAGAADFMINAVLTTTGGLNFVWSYYDHQDRHECEKLVAGFKQAMMERID